MSIRGPKLCLLQAHRDDQSFLSQSTVVTIWSSQGPIHDTSCPKVWSSQGPIHDTSCPKAVIGPLFFYLIFLFVNDHQSSV